MKSFPPLYKKSSTGKITQWRISAHEDTNGAFYSTEFGYVGGKLQETVVSVDEGKNIGKANETTPYEQACLEAESKWKKQLDKGYRENLEETNETRISPMLAYSYKDYAHKINWTNGAYISNKLDGVRCLAYRNTNGEIILQSRQGKIFKALPHINKELKSFLPKNSSIILDGELYVHGEEFQELIHLIKRDDPHEDSIKLQYHIYDCFDPLNLKWKFKDRLAWLKTLSFNKIIRLEENKLIHSTAELETAKKYAKDNAYEGVMIRNADAVYKVGHRSNELLKVKEFQQEEFEIIGGYENKGRAEGQCTIICKTKDGTEFGVKPEGTDEQREWYWNHLDEIIGKMMIVKFFSYTTSKHPVPRFPTGICIRDYE